MNWGGNNTYIIADHLCVYAFKRIPTILVIVFLNLFYKKKRNADKTTRKFLPIFIVYKFDILH